MEKAFDELAKYNNEYLLSNTKQQIISPKPISSIPITTCHELIFVGENEEHLAIITETALEIYNIKTQSIYIHVFFPYIPW
jgi:uncharacterized HAD superfamily protein